MSTTGESYSFDSDAESWVDGSDGQAVRTYDGSYGNSAGSLKTTIAGRNKTDGGGWYLQGTWAALFGVSTGATVTSVWVEAGEYQCTDYAYVAACTLGTHELRDSVGATLATLYSGDAVSGTGSWVDVGSQSAQAVPGGSQAGDTVIQLFVGADLDLENNTSAVVTYYDDNLEYWIEYTEPSAPDVRLLACLCVGS